jgi:hypothetical protein
MQSLVTKAQRLEHASSVVSFADALLATAYLAVIAAQSSLHSHPKVPSTAKEPANAGLHLFHNSTDAKYDGPTSN